MDSGLLFYWFAWILWIIITFFMEKNKYRLLLACWLLLLIIGSDIYLSIGLLKMSLSCLIVFSGAVILQTKMSRKFFHVFASLTIMIGYTAVLIWENHLPITHFFPPALINSCVLYLLAVIMTSGLWNCLACLLLGMAAGELIYSLLIANYAISDMIGDKRFLDSVLMIVASIVCQDFILSLRQKISIRFQTSITKSKPLFRKRAQ